MTEGDARHETRRCPAADALAAQIAAKGAYNSLLLGLGAIALLVGAVGIANVMVMTIIQRRTEIGLRRALGATRRQIAIQFTAEALILSALGGAAGIAVGVLITAGTPDTGAPRCRRRYPRARWRPP